MQTIAPNRNHITMKQFTTNQYETAFMKLMPLRPHHLRMLQANYYAPNKALTATQMEKGRFFTAADTFSYGAQKDVTWDVIFQTIKTTF